MRCLLEKLRFHGRLKSPCQLFDRDFDFCCRIGRKSHQKTGFSIPGGVKPGQAEEFNADTLGSSNSITLR